MTKVILFNFTGAMEKDAIVLLSTVGFIIVMLAVVLLLYYRQQKTNRETQRQLTDRELLQMISNEPDQLLSPHQLSERSGLSLNEARTRLNSLMMFGVFNRSMNRRGRYFYSLYKPLQEVPELRLSTDPFLTVADLLEIFAHYDYRVSPQELIMATGLPLDIIKREMKYFEDQKIVQRLQRSDSNGMVTHKFYVLQDPYRSDPDRFRAQAGKLDLEMREILRNDNLIV